MRFLVSFSLAAGAPTGALMVAGVYGFSLKTPGCSAKGKASGSDMAFPPFAHSQFNSQNQKANPK